MANLCTIFCEIYAAFVLTSFKDNKDICSYLHDNTTPMASHDANIK